jgi:hypothetical protein
VIFSAFARAILASCLALGFSAIYWPSKNMASERPSGENGQRCSPAELLLKVVLAGTLSHYETRGMVEEKQLESMLAAGKKIVSKTRNEMDVRYAWSLLFFSFLKKKKINKCSSKDRV